MRLLQHPNADRERSLFPPWHTAWVIPIIPVISAPWRRPCGMTAEAKRS